MTARLAESHLTRSGGKHCPLGTAGTGAVGTVRLSETDGPGVGAKFRQSSESPSRSSGTRCTATAGLAARSPRRHPAVRSAKYDRGIPHVFQGHARDAADRRKCNDR